MWGGGVCGGTGGFVSLAASCGSYNAPKGFLIVAY